MLSENLSALTHLSERMEKVLKNPQSQKQNLGKKNAGVFNRPLFCDFYPKLPCTLPHVIYEACGRCSRAFQCGSVGAPAAYEPKADSREIYEKIVSLSFFFSEKKILLYETD